MLTVQSPIEKTVTFPSVGNITTGLKTCLSLRHRKSGQLLTLDILSQVPLSRQEVNTAIAAGTGESHWSFKWLGISCSDYEF